ncbi:hypothetical protein AFCDBAGC_1857 [Methylobacterium cerastii]|uniref:Caspase family p20 domain-containing protein n=2 Tax=Methylobacterium cerastii TaxID=932741 RepID=A0ABQ4QFK9_9HYPH|nr:hypothetical protein AFCDBAGC_1857 [Methylobacterium cerastii]
MRVLLIASLMLFGFVQAVLAGAERVALVVGVASYQHAAPLANTRNDANDVGAALQRLGFTVQTVLDPDRSAFERAIRQFGEAARGAEAAVFFYAGHALEVGGHNWLLPTSVELKAPRDLRFEALDVESLLEQTEGMARVTLLFLDACRDNPFQKRLVTGSRDIPRGGLSQVSAGTGTLVAFATAPGTVARDGAGRNSPFTTALLHHIETPGLEVRQLLGLVRRDVREASNGTQLPWENTALEGEFYFKPPKPPPTRVAEQTLRDGTVEAELLFWRSIQNSKDPLDFQAYLARFPNGVFADLARRRAVTAAPASPPVLPPAAVTTQPAARSASFEGRLVEALDRTGDLTKAPWLRDEHRRTVERYLTLKSPKAIAVEPKSGRPFWWNSVSSIAVAEQLALEGCQQSYVSPCTLVASDEALLASDPRQASLRPMERLSYAGRFQADRVPLFDPNGAHDVVQRYGGMSEPKAMAVRPNGAIFTARNGASVAEAEAAALTACNAKTSPFPCFLYAVNNQVVLPQRRTEPTR